MRKLNVKARHITEANFRNSNEKIVGASGDITSGSKQELMLRINELASMVAAGEVYTDSNAPAEVDTRAELAAAYRNPEAWAELGTQLSAELQERVLRDGFMRSIFDRGDVQEGGTPRIRVRTPNVRAIVSKGVGLHHPQFVRDRYLPVDEFRIDVNVRVEELEMHQGSGDILEDKFYESQEQMLVKEDQILVGLLRAATGVYNAATYFSGAFTPSIFQGLRESLTGWALPATTLIISNDILTDMMVSPDFAEFYDQISKYELIQTGRVGAFFGMNIITDGFRDPNLKVLNPGEAFMVTSPGMLGSYTDRGPIRSQPVDSYPDGVPARGWYMFEYMSAALANAKGVAMASR